MNRPKISQKIVRGLNQLLALNTAPAANLSDDAARAKQYVDQMAHWFSVRVPKRSSTNAKKKRRGKRARFIGKGVFRRRRHGLGNK